MRAYHPIYWVTGYHVTLCEGHMIANHPILGHNYSYHIRGDRSPLTAASCSKGQDKYLTLLKRSPTKEQ